MLVGYLRQWEQSAARSPRQYYAFHHRLMIHYERYEALQLESDRRRTVEPPGHAPNDPRIDHHDSEAADAKRLYRADSQPCQRADHYHGERRHAFRHSDGEDRGAGGRVIGHPAEC